MIENLFVINVAGLASRYLDNTDRLPAFSRLMETGQKTAVKPAFPGLTLPGQASLATGAWPEKHGIVANGFFYRDRLEVSFWDQYRSLLQAPPFWERIKDRRPEVKTAVLFWQNTLHGGADIIVTPRPLHAHHGMIQWCYSKPPGLYESLAEELGPFDLMHYWGPLASAVSSRWIMASAISLLNSHRPNLMAVYLPLLDYCCQKLGPDDPAVAADLEIIDALLGEFLDALEALGILKTSTVAVVSEYAMTDVCRCVEPNRLLRQAGLLEVRCIQGREYADMELSRAFAMVDHQIAHIYVQPGWVTAARQALEVVDGIAAVLDRDGRAAYRIDHPNSGELLAVAAPDTWFAYYWWEDPRLAPDFAQTVDIHRKPGYDPLELFLDPEEMKIPLETALIRGSHGAPAQSPEQMAAMVISGAGMDALCLAPTLDMVDLAPLFESLMLGNGKNPLADAGPASRNR